MNFVSFLISNRVRGVSFRQCEGREGGSEVLIVVKAVEVTDLNKFICVRDEWPA